MKNKLLLLPLLVITASSGFLCGCGHSPKVGDVYIEYADNRNNQYALTNGFPAEAICIHKITAVSNGIAYAAVIEVAITNTGEYPFPHNLYGPAENWRKHTEVYTLVKSRHVQ